MKEKTQLKRICRYHRISHNERLEALISLYTDCIYIKIDSIYDDLRPRKKHYELYVSSFYQYLCFPKKLQDNGSSEKLVKKVEKVLDLWMEKEYYSFPEDEKILINGGQNNENIRKN